MKPQWWLKARVQSDFVCVGRRDGHSSRSCYCHGRVMAPLQCSFPHLSPETSVRLSMLLLRNSDWHRKILDTPACLLSSAEELKQWSCINVFFFLKLSYSSSGCRHFILVAGGGAQAHVKREMWFQVLVAASLFLHCENRSAALSLTLWLFDALEHNHHGYVMLGRRRWTTGVITQSGEQLLQ